MRMGVTKKDEKVVVIKVMYNSWKKKGYGTNDDNDDDDDSKKG